MRQPSDLTRGAVKGMTGVMRTSRPFLPHSARNFSQTAFFQAIALRRSIVLPPKLKIRLADFSMGVFARSSLNSAPQFPYLEKKCTNSLCSCSSSPSSRLFIISMNRLFTSTLKMKSLSLYSSGNQNQTTQCPSFRNSSTDSRIELRIAGAAFISWSSIMYPNFSFFVFIFSNLALFHSPITYGLYFIVFPRVLSHTHDKSSTERVMKPREVSKSFTPELSWPVTPTRPFTDSLFDPVGLKPTTPQNAAGIFADPAESVASPNAEHLLATATASPPEEPPLVNAWLYGLVVTPQSLLPVLMLSRPWGTLVWAKGTHPSLMSNCTTSELSYDGEMFLLQPQVVTSPSTLSRSLTVKGIPSGLVLRASSMFMSARNLRSLLVWWLHLETKEPNFSGPDCWDSYDRGMSKKASLEGSLAAFSRFSCCLLRRMILLLRTDSGSLGTIPSIL